MGGHHAGMQARTEQNPHKKRKDGTLLKSTLARRFWYGSGKGIYEKNNGAIATDER